MTLTSGEMAVDHAATTSWQERSQVVTREVGARLGREVRDAVARASSCVPNGAVMLSMFNEHHRPLYTLQIARVRRLGCLMSRFVLLCFNATAPHGRCVRAPPMPPSHYREAQWHHLTWAKWAMLYYAMKHARMAFWFDADAILLRNPFIPEISGLRSEALLYQAEHAKLKPGTNNNLNGGQLLVRSISLPERILDAMPEAFDSRTPLDQVFAYRVLATSEFKHATLPRVFAGSCWYEPDSSEHSRYCELVAFHAHCLGPAQAKLQRLHEVMGNTSSCRFYGGGVDETRWQQQHPKLSESAVSRPSAPPPHRLARSPAARRRHWL